MHQMLSGIWLRKLRPYVAMSLISLLVACGGGGGSGGTPINGGGGNGGGGAQPPASLSDISIVTNRNSVSNLGSETVEVAVTALDANRAALADVPVTFAIDSAGVVTPQSQKTDANGVIKAIASIGSDRTNRTIKVFVTAGAISKSISFDVVDSVTGGKVADLAMTLSRSSLPSDGSQVMEVSVNALDNQRTALGGVPVTFELIDSVSSGGAFVVAGGSTTDASTGKITGTVRLGSSRINRSLSVKATSGTVVRTISFDVVDPRTTESRAADLSLQLDRTNIGNAGSEVVKVVATAVDANRNVFPGIPVTFSVDSSATIAVANSLTNARGQANAEVQIGADKSNRIVTVTARSENLVRTAAFLVSGVTIQSTAVPSLPVAGSSGNRVEFRVVDVNQSAMAGVQIVVRPSITFGSEAQGPVEKTGTTDVNGAYVYTYVAPAQAGGLVFTATAAGKTVDQEVVVPSPSTAVPSASPVPSPPTLTLTPNVVRVNTGADTSNRTEIRALFLAPTSNAPVKNVRVRFDMNGDPNSIGGTIGSGANIVYTDSLGQAITNYVPGGRASPTNGVTIRACWDVVDFAGGTCPNSSLVSFTVVNDPLSITIGTDNSITEGPSKLTYIKRFVLLVVDAAGNPKSDVQLTPSLDLLAFRKGSYAFDKGNGEWYPIAVNSDGTTSTSGGTSLWPVCQNEDVNRNGAIDSGEDLNGNGQLDPRKSDVSVSMVGSTKTDANGTAVVQIEYPKNFGGWAQARITVSAAGVLSPPGVDVRWLPLDPAALKTETPPPAFVNSPYGVIRVLGGNSCANKD
ncbi:hypothetical protein HNQ51_000593 [Inhella inkyongensis]|uniref:Big-1 domain-containing protein n=1 Tax=Inhella inkyongensis TaxID=392593 RepID=A0A840S431_9BURK|nr:Ig-like domain-containing protein [Inhella inkyongensis]MBB5203300.1 hypothetical protein [Inhella inkyongensis]